MYVYNNNIKFKWNKKIQKKNQHDILAKNI